MSLHRSGDPRPLTPEELDAFMQSEAARLARKQIDMSHRVMRDPFWDELEKYLCSLEKEYPRKVKKARIAFRWMFQIAVKREAAAKRRNR